jgi:hypothetical protein
MVPVGRARGSLEILARAEGVGQRAELVGFAERAPEFLAGVNVFVLPSRWESFGIALVEAMAAGRVDIVIGTHRLVQRDVQFHDLGLVIIDEEQRFGVRHKETLKKMKETVDVLTLTATPIPRTLHMAMLGIRDISSLETPPMDRLAIQTTIWRFDLKKIRQAILRDSRLITVGWQVNRRRMFPDIRIIRVHRYRPRRPDDFPGRCL